MPSRALKFCAHRGCDQLVSSGYCPAHERAKQDKESEYVKARGSAASQGYDGTWQRARDMYLTRHPLCEDCSKQGRTTIAVLVHHVKPLRDGGARLDTTNMRALCNACHEKIHGSERWKRRPTTPRGV